MATMSTTQLVALAIAGGWSPGAQAQQAADAAMALSHGDTAYSSGGRYGLWALTPGETGDTPAQLLSPTTNAAAAHKVWAANQAAHTGGGIGDFFSGVANQAGSAVPGVGALTGVDELASIGDKAARWISTPANWIHVGYVVGGAVLVIAGLIVVAKPAINGTANTVTKVATGSTSVGRAAKAIGGAQRRRAARAHAEQQQIAKQRTVVERETVRRATHNRRQERMDARLGMAQQREQRAAERHAAKKKPKTEKEEPSGD